MSKIGMDPDYVRGLSSQVEGQLGVLDSAQSAVALAALVSLNPLEYMLTPGAMILTPWSITQTGIANAEIVLARASARELIGKLLAEAGAQEWASSDLDALYFNPIAWRTEDASKIPQVDLIDIMGPFVWVKNLVGEISDAWGNVDEVLKGIKRWAEPTFKDMVKWWDDLPPWAKGVGKFGKLMPFVGIAVSLADVVVAWQTGDDADKWESGVSFGLDLVSFVPGPVGWVAAGLGIVWDMGWTVAGDIQQISEDPMAPIEYYQENPWMIPVNFIWPPSMQIWGPLAG